MKYAFIVKGNAEIKRFDDCKKAVEYAKAKAGEYNDTCFMRCEDGICYLAESRNGKVTGFYY